MSFFSGLKAAYGTLESELSKTFDSKAGESSNSAKEEAEEPSIYRTPTGGTDQLKVPPQSQRGARDESRERDNEGWSSWDDQDSGANALKRQSRSSKLGSSPSSMSPSRSATSPGRAVMDETKEEGSGRSAGSSPRSGSGSVGMVKGDGSDSRGGGGSPLASSTPSRQAPAGKSQLESLSREDLMKYIKKQMMVLQKSKSKCEELRQELESVRKASTSTTSRSTDSVGDGGRGVLLEELQLARSERDQAVAENRSLRLSVDSLQRDKDISEKYQALNDAHSKLKTLFREQQETLAKEEQAKNAKDDTQTSDSMSAEEELESLRSVNSSLSSEVESLRSKLEEQSESRNDKGKQPSADKGALESKYVELAKKAKKLQIELKSAREKIASQDVEMKAHVEEKCTLAKNVSSFKSQIVVLEEAKGAAAKELDQALTKNKKLEEALGASHTKEAELNAELSGAHSACDELKKNLESSNTHSEELNNELIKLRSKVGTLEQQLSEKEQDSKSKKESSKLAMVREEVLKGEVTSLQSKCDEMEQCLAGKVKLEEAIQNDKHQLEEELKKVSSALEEEKRKTEVLTLAKEEFDKRDLQFQQRTVELEDRSQDLASRLQHLEESNGILESDLRSSQEKLLKTAEDLGAANEELSNSRSLVLKLESKLSETNSELERERSTSEQYKKKISNLEAGRKSDDEKFRNELAEANSQCKELQQVKVEKVELEKKISKLQEILEMRNTDLTTARDKVQTVESALKLKSQECDDHLQQVNALQSTVTDLQGKLGTAERQFESLQKDQVDGQRDQNSELEAKIEVLLGQNKKLNQDSEKWKNELQLNMAEVESLRQQKEEVRADFERVTEEMQRELKESKSSLEKANVSHSEESKKLKALAVKIKKELAESRDQSSSLRQELQAVQTKASHDTEALKKELLSVTEEKQILVESLQAQLLDLQTKCEEESDKAAGASRDSNKYKEELERLKKSSEDELASMKAQLAALSSSKGEEFEHALLEKEKQLQVAREEVKALQADVEAKSAEHKTAQEENEILQYEVTQSQQKMEEMVKQKDSEAKDSNERLSLLQKQCDELKVQVETNKDQYEAGLESIRQDKEHLVKELQKAKESLAELEKSSQVVVEQARGAQEKETAACKEENKKLKAFAMKLKKELAESRERESSLSQELQSSQSSNSQECEELKKKLSSVVEEKGMLVESLQSQLLALQNQYDQRVSLLDKAAGETRKCQAELEEVRELAQSEVSSLQAELAAAKSENNASHMATESVKQELQQVREELQKEVESHSETRQKLSLVEKEAKSSSLMSMELEDYQRSIQALETGMAAKEQLLESAKQESQVHLQGLQNLKKDMDLLSQQRSQSEETVSKMKQLLVKTKKELGEGQRREEGLRTALDDLRAQLEEERQGSEQSKLELAQFTAKVQTMKEQSDVSVENLQRANRGLEQRLALTQSELTATMASLAATQEDYDSYKVRVHSVLKQKSSGAGQAEVTAEMRQKYEKEVTRLNSEVQALRGRLSSIEAEREELLAEHDQLASRHQRLLQEAELSKKSYERAQQEEESRHALRARQQNDVIVQLRQENADVVASFKSQLQSLQADHNKVVLGLKEELKVAQADVSRLQQEADSRVLANAQSNSAQTNSTPAPAVGVTSSSVGGASRGVVEWVRPPFEQRSSGEGMEQSQLESVTGGMPSTPDSSVDFERLLSLGDSELSSVTTSKYDSRPELASGEQSVKHHKQLVVAAKKVQHLTELLRESEASALRLGDQAKLLKEEIRRLERNQEREKGVSNMEYLKNVILKFLHNEGEEKKALVPVIQKLLLLSPHEAKFLEDSVIKGKAPGLPGELDTSEKGPKTSSWSSYVHRWTGY